MSLFVRKCDERDEMRLKCLKCGSEEAVKNGFIGGLQRYKCKRCGYQYTKTKPHGRDDNEKRVAVMLYAAGLSMSVIAKIVGVSVQTVSRWAKIFYAKRRDEIPAVDPMRRVTLRRIRDYFSDLDEDALDKEVFVLTSKMPSGSELRLIVDSPNKVGRKHKTDG